MVVEDTIVVVMVVEQRLRGRQDGARVELLRCAIMWVVVGGIRVGGVKGLGSGCSGVFWRDPYPAENHQLRRRGAGGLWAWTWSSCMKSIFL
ncbi:hypothetical protein HanXRQr2_Chr09g0365881 [Helianthus annuus]|uniref:Uncharacterized protein n=1 Tax=Helianthus annuus TaxID=4232 RepID=A0A9K3I2D4_HELAN|nr:hypothetical protein HanXRQr2_Chr09g0365881 [Helianthus annuus]KAJ0891341.1 hypothetical protein HanPSC8_Chr09g0352571 [Helianthus annuus]